MRFIAILAFIASTTAFACPNLTGNYQACVDPSGEVSPGMELSQRVENGITIYQSVSVNEETGEVERQDMIADGKARRSTEADGYESINTVRCDGDALVVDSTFSDPVSGLSGTVSLKARKEGSKLITEASGNVAGQEFNDRSVCE
jgi:hypothetical protein